MSKLLVQTKTTTKLRTISYGCGCNVSLGSHDTEPVINFCDKHNDYLQGDDKD